MRINLNIGLGTLIFGDTVTESRHFVLKFSEILKVLHDFENLRKF
jgi:hypothetical protein